MEAARRWPHIADQLRILVKDRPELIRVAGSNLLFRLVDQPDIAPSLLEAIEAALPGDALEFWDLAGAIAKRLGSYRRERAEGPGDLARIDADLARKLQRIGDYDSAVPLARNAIALYRPLLSESAANEHALANTLTCLSCCFNSSLLPIEEARASAAEAVALWRRLDPDSSDQIAVGESSNVLGAILSSLNCHEEALVAYREALAAYEAASARTDHLAYAGSANLNISLVLAGLERWAESQHHADAALAYYEQALKAGHHGGGLVGYAKTLRMRAELLWHENQRDQALQACRQAVAAALEAAQLSPEGFGSTLVYVIQQLVFMESDDGAILAEASSEVERAIDIFAEVRMTRPSVNCGFYIEELYRILGRYLEASNAARDTLESLRQSAADNRSLLGDVARAAFWLGHDLSKADEYGQAATAFQEAVNVTQELCDEDRPEYDPAFHDLTLLRLAVALYTLGKYAGAAQVAGRAAQIWKRLERHDPSQYNPVSHARTLTFRGLSLIEAGTIEGGLFFLRKAWQKAADPAFIRADEQGSMRQAIGSDLIAALERLGGSSDEIAGIRTELSPAEEAS